MLIVNWSCMILKTQEENKLFGIQVPIFWDKLLKIYMVLICVLDLLFKMVFIMIHLWEKKKLHLKSMKKLIKK